MTKNESKYRTRIIQEWHLRKYDQMLLDMCVKRRRLSYKKYYYNNVYVLCNKIVWHSAFLSLELSLNWLAIAYVEATQIIAKAFKSE